MKLGTWRKSAQWVSGIILINLLTAAILVSGLSRLISPGPAKAVIAEGAKLALTSSGFAESYDKLRPALEKLTPDDPVAIPGFPRLGLMAKDVKGLTTQKVTSQVAGRLSDKVYEGDLDAEQMGGEQIAGVLKAPAALFSRSTYTAANDAGDILWGLVVIAGAGVVFFGTGFGRLSRLGLLVVIGSLPPWFAYTAALVLTERERSGAGAAGGLDTWALAKPLVPEIIAGRSLAANLLVFGGALLVLAVAGRLISRSFLRKADAPASGLEKVA